MLALGMLPASVFTIMRGLVVIVTALFSIVFLKEKLYRHHGLGVLMIVIGLSTVAYVGAELN